MSAEAIRRDPFPIPTKHTPSAAGKEGWGRAYRHNCYLRGSSPGGMQTPISRDRLVESRGERWGGERDAEGQELARRTLSAVATSEDFSDKSG